MLYHPAVSAYLAKSGIPKEKIYESLKSAQPMSHVGSATEVANLVEFLLSEKSSFITGSLFSIDGGFVN
ncbi:SDR family oxidoreductase [Legionella cincinnatiensis]|uniref:SDR family oxidoreductase n=1 Tax=Legionella cincinnatiensis TaxID=28085 RepID=UPI003082FAB6